MAAMSETSPGDEGQPTAHETSDAYFEAVYDQLRALAHSRLRKETPGQTIQSTELVHEAYLRLRGTGDRKWANRAHFFAAAAEAMRRILIDRARARSSVKRGGNEEGRPLERLSMDAVEVASLADDQDPELILAFDRAIERLAEHDERVARVVKLRFYAGLTVEEVAELLETTPRTIWRDWSFGRAWLYRALSSG